VNAVKKEIDINVDTHQMGSIESALDNDHFDTSKLAIEEQLAIAANSVDSKTIGKWTIQLRQSTYKDTDAVLWQFSGKDETHRYQNTAACRKAHQVYLQREADQAQNDQENSDAAGVAGGIAGGVLGGCFKKGILNWRKKKEASFVLIAGQKMIVKQNFASNVANH
jgi:hypothetical protein